MANKFKRLFPEISQGTDVPLEERQYDAPREIAGSPKPIEAVVPRFLTDTITGAPGMVAGILRSMYDYQPEKYKDSKVNEAKIPDWVLTAITHPDYSKTEEGQKAIEFAKKNIGKKENLLNKLSLREEQQLKDKANEFITHADSLPREIPLSDEGARLIRSPNNDEWYQQRWDLLTKKGNFGQEAVPEWITVSKDRDAIPSVSYLKDLPEELKGNALAAQAYTALAKEYGTLRSDPTGITSSKIKKAFWDQFGQPVGNTWDNKGRYEVPFKVNAAEEMKPIKDRYQQLSDKAAEELDLLYRVANREKRPEGWYADELPSTPIQFDKEPNKIESLMNQWLYGTPIEKKKR